MKEDASAEGYKDRDRYANQTDWNHGKNDGFGKAGHETSQSQRGLDSESEQNNSKKGSTHYGG